MKFSFSPLGLLSAVFALAFAPAAPAASISSFEYSDYRGSDFYAFFQADHTLTTSLALTPGLSFSGNPYVSGWSPEKNVNLYASFTIKTLPGYQMTLTDLTSDPFGTTPTNIYWGMRIDEGSGYGAWTFSDERAIGGSPGVFQPWDFADVTTTGTVQFAFFAYGSANPLIAGPGAETGGYETPEIAVNGSVSPVPEPSTIALCLAGAGLAIVLTRRNKRANA